MAAVAIGFAVALLIFEGVLRMVAFLLTSGVVLAVLDRAWPSTNDSDEGHRERGRP